MSQQTVPSSLEALFNGVASLLSGYSGIRGSSFIKVAGFTPQVSSFAKASEDKSKQASKQASKPLLK